MKSYSKVFLVVMVGLSVPMFGCKKKSKHKGANPVVQNPPPQLDDQYGREITEGPKRIFRGTDKIFWIEANPSTIKKGETVQFAGACGPSNSGQLSWNFGDNVSAAPTAPVVTGFTASHAYPAVGTYKVIGTCVANGATQTGTLTIEVVASTGVVGGGGGGFIDPGQSSPLQNATPSGTIPGGGGTTPPPGNGYHPR